jgi:hypothetical protein
MQFLKKTKQGNLHYILSDGRLGAVYPETGYVRVSRSMNGFADDERSQFFKKRQRQYNIDAIKNGNTGNVAMYQINPQRKYDRYVVWDTDKYGRELYCKYTATERVLYPNDTVTLVLLLQKFETKNCK